MCLHCQFILHYYSKHFRYHTVLQLLIYYIDPVEIYRKYRADLIQLLSSSSIQLANELYSNGLVEHIAIDDASIQELSGYKKATYVFNCFDNFLNASENKKLVLSQFCDVLQGSYTTSRKLISRMRQELRNCREHEPPSVSVLPKPHESMKSQQKSIATSTTVPIATMIDVFSKLDISRGTHAHTYNTYN